MRERPPLPTKADLAQITDPQVLRDLLDDLEATTTSIETQLEFDIDGDDDWYARARGALIAHRIAAKMATRRLAALKPMAFRPSAKAAPSKRDPDENHPLTNEVLAAPPAIDIRALQTEAEVSATVLWIVDRINAVDADRSSEVGLPAGQRDEGFLAATKGVLKALKAVRLQLDSRRGTMKRREKEADQAALEARRERLFIAAARELLPAETYKALWAHVDRDQIGASDVGRAA